MTKQITISKELKALDSALSSALNLSHSVMDNLVTRGTQVLAVRDLVKSAEAMGYVRAVMDTDGGFLTDGKEYSNQELGDCITNGLLAGVRITGNEMNIISGKMMIVLNGYMRLCREFNDGDKQVLNMRIIVGELKAESGLMRIPMTITYDLLKTETGETYEGKVFDSVAQLSMKPGENADSWIGKGKRRVLKDFYEFLTGQTINDDEVGQAERSDSQRPNLKGEVKGKHTVEKPTPVKEVA